MPSRVPINMNKYKPAINFTIPILLRFSLSTNMDDEQLAKFNLQFKTANENKTMTDFLRETFYKNLKIKEGREFEVFLEPEIKKMKDRIYEKLGVNRDNSFSKIFMNLIEKYNKEEIK